jgi:hypothetical protein
MKCLDGKASAYVCQNYKCQKPVTDVEKMLALLRVKKVPLHEILYDRISDFTSFFKYQIYKGTGKRHEI